ncbi:hypothetical protein JVX93_20055 [Mycolicibacterium boenickei]|nr:hypothetical protein JVX93_20055 [Mycolicibacterium boenickei]
MNRSICAVAVAMGLLAAAAPASAAPTGGTRAPDVVRDLTAAGYTVQINGNNGVPLSLCTVTDVHGVPAARSALQFTTVYVDVVCQQDG